MINYIARSDANKYNVMQNVAILYLLSIKCKLEVLIENWIFFLQKSHANFNNLQLQNWLYTEINRPWHASDQTYKV